MANRPSPLRTASPRYRSSSTPSPHSGLSRTPTRLSQFESIIRPRLSSVSSSYSTPLLPSDLTEDQTEVEQFNSRKLGTPIKEQWTPTDRKWVQFSRQIRHAERAVREDQPVQLEADLESDTFLVGTEYETSARFGLSGIANDLKAVRIPLNIVVLLDKSNSMDGDKIESAKDSCRMILENLQPGDRCTIMAFASNADVVVRTFEKGSRPLKKAFESISELQAEGSTDMGAAMRSVSVMAKRTFAGDRVNRVILLTDGHPTKAQNLIDTVSDLAKIAVYTTSLGVGDDYNEDLLAKLADFGQGSYYYVNDNAQMTELLRKELAALGMVVARNVHIVVQPVNGVSIESVTGYTFERKGNGAVDILVGDLTSKDRKDILATISYRMEATGSHQLLSVTVSYTDALTNQLSQSSTLSANFVDDISEVKVAAPVAVVVQKIQKVQAAEAVRTAEKLMKENKMEEGIQTLSKQADRIEKRNRELGSKELDQVASEMRKMISDTQAQQKQPAASSSSETGSGASAAATRQFSKKAKEFARRMERE